MSLTAIKTAVFDRLIAEAGLPALYFNNVESASLPLPPVSNHLRPFVLPSDTRTIGVRTLNQEIGLIQVSIFVGKGQGEIVSSNIASQILDLFPRNLDLVACRIDSIGSIAPSFYDQGWHITPVSIPYQNLC